METKLQKYIKHNGITQRWFAKQIGTTPNNLLSLLRGNTTPSLKTAYKIEQKTGGLVTVYDWIKEEWKKEILQEYLES